MIIGKYGYLGSWGSGGMVDRRIDGWLDRCSFVQVQ